MQLKSQRRTTARLTKSGRAGFTLVEAMVSLAVLVVTGVGGMSGFMLLNRYASDNRDRNAARLLCQERIEQMLTLPFRPQAGSVPSVTGQDGKTYYLLGQSTDYVTGTGSYSGGSGSQTSNEPVTIYKQPDGKSMVTGTRTTNIAASGITNVMCATATVTYTVRGQTNTCTLYTLRASD